LIAVVISYFKNNVVLLNNLIELSSKTVMKMDDLCLLLSLLISVPICDVQIEVEKTTLKECCGTICKQTPRYRKVKDIIINKR
jgi:hypothetical protein